MPEDSATETARLYPGLAVLLALLLCKGLLYGVAFLAIVGVTVNIPPGPWAVAVDIAVLLAIAAFAANRRRHGSNMPVLLAVAGGLLVIANMHGFVPVVLEWTGLGCLVAAATLDWVALRKARGA